jgi:hypothetical protein
MYGTIARLTVKAGHEEAFLNAGEQEWAAPPPGIIFDVLYRSDRDPREFWLAVGFESKDAYTANASSAMQHQRYVQLRALLETDPEWHDGEIVSERRS